MRCLYVLFFILPIGFSAGALDSNKIINLVKEKKWADADRELMAAQQQQPGKAWLYSTHFWVLQNLKDFKRARSVGQIALARFPGDQKVRLGFARVLSAEAGELFYAKKYDACLGVAEESIQVFETASARNWQGNALRTLKNYEKAIKVYEDALKKFPGYKWLKPNLAAARYSYGRDLQKKGKLKKGHQSIAQAYQLEKKDYILWGMADSYRRQKKFQKALGLFQQGSREYPGYKAFKQSIPYTRYLAFKASLKKNKKAKIKKEIELASKRLSPAKKLNDQFYDVQIIRAGLRHLANGKYFDRIMKPLLKKFAHDPFIFDMYGFHYYALHRLKKNKPAKLKQHKKKAIDYRRRAFRMFEKKNGRASERMNIGRPLEGLQMVWSEFGGSAMTHNGYAHYCYDFAAVDESKKNIRSGTSGKENSDYYMFGQPIYAVADGKVTAVRSKEPDNEPGGFASQANVIDIDHGDFISFYVHLKQNGILVKEGEQVKKGQLIGYAGNSGMSAESHLHFCLYPVEGERFSLPFRFESFRIIKKDDSTEFSDRPLRESEVIDFGK